MVEDVHKPSNVSEMQRLLTEHIAKTDAKEKSTYKLETQAIMAIDSTIWVLRTNWEYGA